jgi:hypothetical protein
MHLPFGSVGEYNIFGYLGMSGIPVAPLAQFPAEGKNAIFTLHSAGDPELAGKLLGRLREGKDIFMTWGLWQRLQSSEFKNTLNLLGSGGSVASDGFRLKQGWFHQEFLKADRAFSFPRIATTTWPYARDVAVVVDDNDYGVLLDVEYLRGRIYILNMPDNSYDLLRLPAPVLNIIRRAFAAELGVQLDGPGGVALYLFGDKQYVLYNMSDESAAMSLKFVRDIASSGWRELVGRRDLSVVRDSTYARHGGPAISSVSVTLKPFEIAVVQEP